MGFGYPAVDKARRGIGEDAPCLRWPAWIEDVTVRVVEFGGGHDERNTVYPAFCSSYVDFSCSGVNDAV